MAVHVLQAGLVNVPMSVFRSVGVGVRVLMLDVVVLVRGVLVRVRDGSVLMLVRVRLVVGVLLRHLFLLT